MQSYIERMKPSDACAVHHVQNCHRCDNLNCCDNISDNMVHRVYRVNTAVGPCIEWSEDGVASHLEDMDFGDSVKIEVVKMTLDEFRSLKEFES